MALSRLILLVSVLLVSGCALLGRGGRGLEPSSIEIGERSFTLVRPQESDSIVVDGVTYWVESRFVTDSVLWVQSRIVAKNQTTESAEASHGACLPLVRLYLTPSRGGLPIWDEARTLTELEGCSGGVRRGSRIEPGEARQLHMVAVAPRRLEAFLPPRRYYFSVVFWLGGAAYEVASGQGELEH